MVDIKNILYPVDFSDYNRQVLPYVRTLVERLDATLHLLHVVSDLRSSVGIYLSYLDMGRIMEEYQVEAGKALREFAAKHLGDIGEVNQHVIKGRAAPEIIRFARERGMHLIIMGTHGRTGLDHAVFGSVAEKVVKHSPVPVLTVSPHHV